MSEIDNDNYNKQYVNGYNQENNRRKRWQEQWNKMTPAQRAFVVLLIVIWVGLGLAAYYTSFVCTLPDKGGGDALKIAMFIAALVLGPFWWLLYFAVRRYGYCK